MPLSRMNAVIPCCFFAGSVTASTTNTLPTEPWVMNVLVPVSVQLPSGSRSARVRAPAASEPDPGSVRPQAPSAAPLASRGRYFCFCSSLPASRMCPVHSPLCDATVIATEPSTMASCSTTAEIACMPISAPP